MFSVFISVAIIHQTKTLDQIQTHNERLVQDLRLYDDSKPTQSLNNLPAADNEDNQSVESLDSLESEQPSTRSHQINPQPFPYDSNISQQASANDHEVAGGGTYRQESPTVIQAEFKAKANSSVVQKQTGRVHSAPVQRQLTKTRATPTTDSNVFLGFQVVNTADYSKLNKNESNKHKNTDTLAVERIAAENFSPDQQNGDSVSRRNQVQHAGDKYSEPQNEQPQKAHNNSILNKTDGKTMITNNLFSKLF